MIIQRGKVIDMLKGMAKSGEIPADVQLIITQKLLDSGEMLKPDKEELEYALHLSSESHVSPQGKKQPSDGLGVQNYQNAIKNDYSEN